MASRAEWMFGIFAIGLQMAIKLNNNAWEKMCSAVCNEVGLFCRCNLKYNTDQTVIPQIIRLLFIQDTISDTTLDFL